MCELPSRFRLFCIPTNLTESNPFFSLFIFVSGWYFPGPYLWCLLHHFSNRGVSSEQHLQSGSGWVGYLWPPTHMFDPLGHVYNIEFRSMLTWRWHKKNRISVKNSNQYQKPETRVSLQKPNKCFNTSFILKMFRQPFRVTEVTFATQKRGAPNPVAPTRRSTSISGCRKH